MRSANLAFYFLPLFIGASAAAAPLSLLEAMQKAEDASHEVIASQQSENAADAAIGEAQSHYYPTLDFEAVDSEGFPGSSGVLGIGGVMGSPYRSGMAYGLVAKATIWDFGRTSGTVQAQKHEKLAAAESTRIHVAHIDQETATAYLDCALFRSQINAWHFVWDEARVVSTEVNKFVTTGQKSVVERMLAKSQEEEAQTAEAMYREKARLSLERLRLLTAMDIGGVSCPALEDMGDLQNFKIVSEGSDPWTARAKQESLAAESRVDQAKADYLPKLEAMGTVGEMAKARLVPEEHSAMAIGLTWPIFEGFGTKEKVRQNQALAAEKAADVEAVQEERAQVITRYDETLESAKVKLSHLVGEQKLASDSLRLAQKRYRDLQGSLIDVREALRNLSRVKSDWNETQSAYLSAKVAKELFLGYRSR